MADIFYIILIIWVLWRIFGSSIRTTVYHRHTFEQPPKKEGEVSISQPSDKDRKNESDRGEYVDYEEVK